MNGGLDEQQGMNRGISGFRVGDRVVSNGPHAKVVCVPGVDWRIK